MSELRKLKQELIEYKECSRQIKSHWTDHKSDDFFRKHIDEVIEKSGDYVFFCEKLLSLLEESKNLI